MAFCEMMWLSCRILKRRCGVLWVVGSGFGIFSSRRVYNQSLRDYVLNIEKYKVVQISPKSKGLQIFWVILFHNIEIIVDF